MNELIISIVNFIELICKEAESTSNRIHKYFKDVSDVLNENGRENYLFKCFVIPDDEVRLSLVNCILQVPQKQLDYQEISNLMKTISESKNIGAGKAEEIFSTIFLILINLVTDTEQPAFKNFRIKDGSNAIFHWLEILHKNQKRFIEEEEEADEKLMLSVSCLFFLKESSMSPEMKVHMLDNSDFAETFQEILISEQNFTFESHKHVPIEIETTTLGSRIWNLKQLLIGKKQLEPMKGVSFRVIQQIANVLQNIDLNKPFKLKPSPGKSKTDCMTEKLIENYQKRIDSELDLWDDKQEAAYMKSLVRDKAIKEKMKEEHKDFNEGSGLYLLILFLGKIDKRYEENFEEASKVNNLLKWEISTKINSQLETYSTEYKLWMKYKKNPQKGIKELITMKLVSEEYINSKRKEDHRSKERKNDENKEIDQVKLNISFQK